LGENPQWGRFWENPLLTTEECDLMKAARDALQAALMNSGAEQGLIHGDLVSENVLLHSARINFIDFDDCGLGFRAQDLATALVKYLHEPDFNDLKRALLDGYRMHKPMNDSWVEQFLLMRHLSYLGWIVPRMANAGGEARCRHFIALAIPMARRYLLNPAQFKVS
jgi:Ser/Thr protein kinase RdoA (MazF antagonist)